MKDWDTMTLSERITSFPDRHPFPFKAVLHIVIFQAPAVSWFAVDVLMQRMGYLPIDVRRESEDGALVLSAPTYACPDANL